MSSKNIRYAAWVTLNIVIAKYVNEVVQEPYMDEPFHVPQAQAYCRGDWSYWDPKITTPPGLYITSIALRKLFLLPCTVSILRLTNVFLLSLLPPLLDQILHRIRLTTYPPTPNFRSWLEPSLESLTISSFPVLWFFAFLYYTDVGSLVFVLLALWASRSGKHWLAAVIGLFACSFRQTNIIWLLFSLGASGMHELHYNVHKQKQVENLLKPRYDQDRTPTYFMFDHDPLGERAEFLDFLVASLTLITERATTLPLFPSYIAATLTFVAFVIWNGGIVLGDKSNHVPATHIPQLYYFLCAATFFGWPVLCSSKHGIQGLAKAVWKRMFGAWWLVTRTAVFTVMVLFTIWKYTIHHPFLLSDNRHYTFYVWRRIFLAHPLVPYLLAPMYIALGWAWFLRLGESNSLLTTLLIPVFTLPSLLPAPLLEPRYFIIPYILLRMQAGKDRMPKSMLIAEGVWYALINAVTMYIFLHKDRLGPDGIIRFMW